MSSGSAELKRGSEHLDIGQFERVTFPTGGAITKTQVLAPPDLVEPLNLQPITVADLKRDPVHFEWKPVRTAKTLRISGQHHGDVQSRDRWTRKYAGESVDVTGLDPGDYFWRVRAIDDEQ